MEKWTENINGEPYTSRGVRTVRRRVLGNTTIVIWKGAGCLAYIVTTNIRSDGSSINLHNIGKTRSEAARKQIENEYSLVRAEDHKRSVFKLSPVSLSAADYGRAETKQAISNVVQTVIKDYHFSSLAELNAVLGQYRVHADAGTEGSRIRQNQGLVFRVLGPDGERVGVPIKASDFHFKPTLKKLETLFEKGAIERKRHAVRLKNTIDLTLARKDAYSLSGFASALGQQGVSMLARASQTGAVYGVTYVDHRTKSVFNGSDLGKAYSAKALQQTLQAAFTEQQSLSGVHLKIQPVQAAALELQSQGEHLALHGHEPGDDRLLGELLQSQSADPQVPWQLRKPRKKTRKKSM